MISDGMSLPKIEFRSSEAGDAASVALTVAADSVTIAACENNTVVVHTGREPFIVMNGYVDISSIHICTDVADIAPGFSNPSPLVEAARLRARGAELIAAADRLDGGLSESAREVLDDMAQQMRRVAPRDVSAPE